MLDAGARLRLPAAARRTAQQYGRPDLRRRAADAGDRPRADDQPETAGARRGHGGLAPLIRREIWDRLAALKRDGLSILVIDKNVDPLLRLSDRHLILEKGGIGWDVDS